MKYKHMLISNVLMSNKVCELYKISLKQMKTEITVTMLYQVENLYSAKICIISLALNIFLGFVFADMKQELDGFSWYITLYVLTKLHSKAKSGILYTYTSLCPIFISNMLHLTYNSYISQSHG